WQQFLKPLQKDAPEWKKYSEAFLEKMAWMQDVKKEKLGPSLWHMHPLVFLDSIADKFTDIIEFQTTLGIYRISKNSAEFILREEGYQESPYVPKNSSASGVTLGYGYDLGQQTKEKMRSAIAEFYTEQQLIRLEAVIGLTGKDAVNSLEGIKDIKISKDKAVSLAMKMKATYAQTVVDTYPDALNTHPHCQGAILSLVINRGTSFNKPSPESRIEMKNIQLDFSQGNLSDIPVQIRSMKRLWIGKGLDGLIRRREGEAELFEEGLIK
ncbi:MAG: pesticin C-terminus-like muramidase, partial [Yersiniaceae bacterium]|nr:pesticin C-terminus-like muramidase [Yersiniaceae bacterium]